mmetsp:Transcript_4787/g.17430  ORF Transcript_4787/g.17430 Transcript_4787/m.17430 type:complete len:380 (-) Transcript_4787:118-1257(-)
MCTFYTSFALLPTTDFQPSVMRSAQCILLPHCKHVERTGARRACKLEVVARPHKRGYITVACKAGHQWVWCQRCCDCNLEYKGCTQPQHWLERDSFDTGKRNHMQCHSTNCSTPPKVLGKRQRSSPTCVATAESSAPRLLPISALLSNACNDGNKIPTLVTPDLQFDKHLQPSCALPPSTYPIMQPLQDATVDSKKNVCMLGHCKYVDRKQSKFCMCSLTLRSHPRGLTMISCSAGHQYVWCRQCCNCTPAGSYGCKNPNHWLERDSFDTGKRNHMQRHIKDEVDVKPLLGLSCTNDSPSPEPLHEIGEGNELKRIKLMPEEVKLPAVTELRASFGSHVCFDGQKQVESSDDLASQLGSVNTTAAVLALVALQQSFAVE